MKKVKKLAALLLALTLAMTSFTGCKETDQQSVSNGTGNGTKKAGETGTSSVNNTAPEETTIKILFKGPKTEEFDSIYEEFLNRTKDTLNVNLDITWVEHADYKDKLNLEMTSGADYDLVFDAPWLQLKNLAADGYYADLSGYFNNDAYPGLKSAFSETIMENNLWFGKLCYIPLLRAYGNGIPAVHYRADWAEEWGVGSIDSMDKLEEYWAKAKENGVLPCAVSNTRGFYQLYTVGGGVTAEAGIQTFAVGNSTYWVYIKDNKVAAIAMEGEGDEAFKDFPEGWNYDFAADRYEKFAQWQKEGYISADSMTLTDANTPFWSGEAASKIGTLDDIENDRGNIEKYSPGARIGEFIYNDGIRNMEPGAYPTTFAANNGLCIPASSKNIDATMRFLDWLFASEENHNLFELGIEGKDYNAVGENQYEALTEYPVNWPGYSFTWNPNYVKFSSIIPEDLLKYRMWELEESSYMKLPVCGFTFDASDVDISTIAAQVKAVTDKVSTTKLHGILSNGTNSYSSAEEMLKENVEEAKAAGADKIEDELVKQLNEFFASR